MIKRNEIKLRGLSGTTLLTLVAALVMVIGGTSVCMASGIYEELGRRAVSAYKNASNGFHIAQVQAEIYAASEGLFPLFGDAGRLMDKPVLIPSTATQEARKVLGLIDSRRTVLTAVIANAAGSDQEKIAGAPSLDQADLARKAKAQQSADNLLLSQFDQIILVIRKDFQTKLNVSF